MTLSAETTHHLFRKESTAREWMQARLATLSATPIALLSERLTTSLRASVATHMAEMEARGEEEATDVPA